MNKKTLKALKASIKHWEENVAAKTVRSAAVGESGCALCTLFINNDPSCHGCPVDKTTGGQGCYETPYYPAEDTYYYWLLKRNGSAHEDFRAAAQKEVDFLKSLLPEGET